MNNTCQRLIEDKNDGRPLYFKCGRQIKFRISYTDTSRGERVNECVCGIHRGSLKKWAARVERKYHFKPEYSEEKI